MWDSTSFRLGVSVSQNGQSICIIGKGKVSHTFSFSVSSLHPVDLIRFISCNWIQSYLSVPSSHLMCSIHISLCGTKKCGWNFKSFLMFFDIKLSCAPFIATVSFILQQLFDPVIHFLVGWLAGSSLLSRFQFNFFFSFFLYRVAGFHFQYFTLMVLNLKTKAWDSEFSIEWIKLNFILWDRDRDD